MKVKAGDELRDSAARLLSHRFGTAHTEKRALGKKVDVFFELDNFGKKQRLYVEAKDYARPLHRADVVGIWSDYSGIISRNSPATLLVVSRNGLATDADVFVQDEQALMRHQTIREIENDALGLDQYVHAQRRAFEEDGLSEYYIPAHAREVTYEAGVRGENAKQEDIFESIKDWIESSDEQPIAILAGYGAGKSSLARRIISYQSKRAAENSGDRRPVLIKLGGLTRFSSIEGLLGATFTSEFPTPNFNFHVFSDLNRAGRLLLVLDGFDEMKHAMSWSEFKNQIRDLNRLNDGLAKVILLGRPTAFLSFDEHLLVLRGVQKFGTQARRNLDWPEFREYELCEFSPEEISEFVGRYLEYKLGKFKAHSALIKSRVSEVRKIAELDHAIFAKPVHLKILVDLAADTSVDLSPLAGQVTRWSLYQVFFADLSDRESGKEARSPVDASLRMKFLRDLAYWLWVQKDGRISFTADEIPSDVFPVGEESMEDRDVAAREFLTGAFIEKKGGETFFFGHRSFAEYLVADYLVNNAPTSSGYGLYSNLVRDGVAQFLNDYPDSRVFETWARGLGGARGLIYVEFLVFIQFKVGSNIDLRQSLPERDGVRAIYRTIVESTPDLLAGAPLPDPEILIRNMEQLLRNCDSQYFTDVCEFGLRLRGDLDQRSHQSIAVFIVGVLLERLFREADVDLSARKTFVAANRDIDRQMAFRALSDVVNDSDDRYILFNWEPILDWTSGDGRHSGRIALAIRERGEGYSLPVQHRLRWSSVLEQIDPSVRQKVREHYRMSNSLKDVVTLQTQKRKKARRA